MEFHHLRNSSGAPIRQISVARAASLPEADTSDKRLPSPRSQRCYVRVHARFDTRPLPGGLQRRLHCWVDGVEGMRHHRANVNTWRQDGDGTAD